MSEASLSLKVFAAKVKLKAVFSVAVLSPTGLSSVGASSAPLMVIVII